MSRSASMALGLALTLGFGPWSCTATRKLAYAPGELRAEIERRAPGMPPGEVVVPFEVTAEQVALARRVVEGASTDFERVRLLAEAIFDPRAYGVQYAPTATEAAGAASPGAEGNCLVVASLFIGLARALGLDALYIDASTRVHETTLRGDDVAVNAGHVTAMVRTAVQDLGLDFARMGKIRWFRVLDDLEAVAHFYNNRGFDLIERARAHGEAPDWARAAREFRWAVQVAPTFARGWNNLGIAEARLGRTQSAVAAYRTAIARDPDLAAPHNNLGALYLQIGLVAEALDALEVAARLESRAPHVQFNLAVARLESGDREGAARALGRALALRQDYPGARDLAARIGMATAGP